jgi:glycosyltransferase involved in cell wall biosynthesis
VLPTLFEANSLPIFEAWLDDTPVACSNVTALPEQVADAGLLFDPLDVTAIGDALSRIFSDAQLREELRAKGRRRLADFAWERTARAYRAVYRRTAGERLSDEDRMLLEWNWMQDPRRGGEVLNVMKSSAGAVGQAKRC